MFTYPLTMKAAQGIERDQWALGDALLEECGPPGEDGARNGSSEKLEAAQAELAANGMPYAFNTLRQYRDISAAFPPATIVAGLSHGVHKVCGTPEMLTAVLKAWEKENPTQKLTEPSCSRILTEIRRQNAEAYQRENAKEILKHEEAKERHLEAKEKITKAKKKKLTASTPTARARAATEVEEAVKAAKRAAQEVEETMPPPKGDPNAVPEESKMLSVLFISEMISKAQKAKILGNDALEMAEEKVASYSQGNEYHEIGEDDFAAVIEMSLLAAERWREVAVFFQKASKNRGVHLSVVGE